MAVISLINTQTLTQLATYPSYEELPWYKRLFFPRRLADALAQFRIQSNSSNAWIVCNTFLNHTWFFQRWIFSLLSEFSASPLIESLRILRRNNLLNGEVGEANFEAVIQYGEPNLLFLAFEHLNDYGFLAQEDAQANCKMVLEASDTYAAAQALRWMPKSCLTGESGQAIRNILTRSSEPFSATALLRRMNEEGLLDGEHAETNREGAIETLNLSHYGLFHALRFLWQNDNEPPLTQEEKLNRFNDLIRYSSILFGGVLREDVWIDIPPHALNTENFNEFIRIAQNHENDVTQGRAALLEYINQHIIRLPQQRNNVLNNWQSTHTASINESASHTATQLLNQYGDNIFGKKLDQVIKDLLHWGNARLSHATTLKEQAALRGLKRITELTYVHSDSRSGVSTRQFLALFWLAIHDKEHLIGKNLENAKEQLIQGLYEIQRGYNLNDKGIDDNQSKDIPICVAGTFNKLVEKLIGLHPAAELRYITRETANAKFEILVREKAVLHLKRLKSQGLLTAELLEVLAKGLAPIWDAISPDIKKTFLEEFRSVYPDGSDDFIALMEAGMGTIVDEKILADLKQTLDSSLVASSLAINHSPRLFKSEDSAKKPEGGDAAPSLHH